MVNKVNNFQRTLEIATINWNINLLQACWINCIIAN